MFLCIFYKKYFYLDGLYDVFSYKRKYICAIYEKKNKNKLMKKNENES